MNSKGDYIADLERFDGTRILCIGDLMLDRFVYGKVTRISPEAPIPVLKIDRETLMLGGMGNVVGNIHSLGGKPTVVTMIGDDAAARTVEGLLSQIGIDTDGILLEAGHVTAVKTRFVSGSQQMLRADQESPRKLNEAEERRVIALIEAMSQSADGIVISDYAKGVVTEGVAQAAVEAARRHGIPLLVDSKPASFGFFAGATILKPNRGELAAATGMPVDTDDQVVLAARALMTKVGVATMVVTRSEQGMSIVTPTDEPEHLRAQAREVFETSGAGDTSLATLALAVASGAELLDAAELANHAAGIVVGKMGTAAVSQAELRDALSLDRLSASTKIMSIEDAADEAERWRARGVRVGFTNGCFDLLHPGHISILSQARRACDRLIVGLNSDASVKRLKGETRPVQDQYARAAVLAALEDVDAVVIFGEDTPKEAIERLRPDVLVKGADYTVETVVGADYVMAYGGKVVLAELKQGHSTTGMIGRMKG